MDDKRNVEFEFAYLLDPVASTLASSGTVAAFDADAVHFEDGSDQSAPRADVNAEGAEPPFLGSTPWEPVGAVDGDDVPVIGLTRIDPSRSNTFDQMSTPHVESTADVMPDVDLDGPGAPATDPLRVPLGGQLSAPSGPPPTDRAPTVVGPPPLPAVRLHDDLLPTRRRRWGRRAG
jgi:hypothetical protein